MKSSLNKKMIIVALSALSIFSLLSAQEMSLSAAQILNKVDQCINGPADQEMKMRLVLIDKNGKEEAREIIMMQKGSDKRIGKFIAPADQKGIGFLSLPDNVFYIYLPAYKKTRRIASHIKNTKFAGTDFTYEDMEAKKYSDNWTAQVLGIENNQYKLVLTPKQGVTSEYSKMILLIDAENFYPTRIEYYDKGAKLCKQITRNKVEKISGYWISKESVMEDLKSAHKTKMILEDVKFNSDIADSKFTERYLAQ